MPSSFKDASKIAPRLPSCQTPFLVRSVSVISLNNYVDNQARKSEMEFENALVVHASQLLGTPCAAVAVRHGALRFCMCACKLASRTRSGFTDVFAWCLLMLVVLQRQDLHNVKYVDPSDGVKSCEFDAVVEVNFDQPYQQTSLLASSGKAFILGECKASTRSRCWVLVLRSLRRVNRAASTVTAAIRERLPSTTILGRAWATRPTAISDWQDHIRRVSGHPTQLG